MRSVLLLSALLSLAAPASAATFSTLHGFCSGTGCSDGSVPSGGLVMDALGRLYGTTFGGGAHDGGAVYMLVPNADRTAWTNQVLYSFCARKSCRDSKGPGGPLVLDTQGNLYGTTQGDTFNGIHPSIFKLSPNADRSTWTLKTLYRLCLRSSCTRGQQIVAGLTYAGAATGALYDGAAPLYGAAAFGGANNRGLVFSLTPAGTHATQKVLYNFCMLAACADGSVPENRLTVDGNGDILGTAGFGGAHQSGALFKLTPAGGGSWSESVLYDFCAQTQCADGNSTSSPVIEDAAGNLFGTTSNGGVQNSGTLYKLASDGTFTVLKHFCEQQGCTDGAHPQGELAMGADGTLYGTTTGGGHSRNGVGGVVFAQGTGGYAVLHVFCAEHGCSDGYQPFYGAIEDASGTLYGTTQRGPGKDGDAGTVFAIAP